MSSDPGDDQEQRRSTFSGLLDISSFSYSSDGQPPATCRTKDGDTSKSPVRNKSSRGLASTPPSATKRKLRTVVTEEDSEQETVEKATRTTTTATTTTTPRGRGRTRIKSRLASPAELPASQSNYRDTVQPNLILIFVGVNPGITTGTTGHAYAHPSNLYWKLLYHAGITVRLHPARDTAALPELYGVGNTNLVVRPTRDASLLKRPELEEGARNLLRKMSDAAPEAVCLVGKGIWEAVWRVRKGRAIRKEEFHYGWQDEKENMGTARVFVSTTTSGLAAGMSMDEKRKVWEELGVWVKERRRERAADGTAGSAPLVQ